MASRIEALPNWLLAIGPLVVLGSVATLLYLTSPFGDLEGMAEASMGEVLWMMTVIGLFAGVVPVAIGMLWFPFVKGLDNVWVHALLALSAGILAFIGFEMSEEAIDIVAEIAADDAGTTLTLGAAGLGVFGLLGTFFLMKWLSDWRRGQFHNTPGEGRQIDQRAGLRVAYLMAIGLGLHSVGEGLAIGTSYAVGEFTAVTLLVVGFILHNIVEGVTIVAAVGRDSDRPSLWHFAAMGLLAGGPLVVGGWLGALAFSPLIAVFFLAIGVGAIGEVIWEVVELVRVDTGTVLSRVNVAVFGLGVLLMFVLEDLIVEGLLL